MNFTPNLSLYRAFREVAKTYPNNVAIYFYNNKISFSKLDKEIDKWASILQNDFDIQKGDSVLISLPNIPQVIVLFYAVNKIGAVANMVHPHTPMEQMQKFYDESNCKLAFLFSQKVYKALNEYKKFAGNIILCDIETYFNGKIIKHLVDIYFSSSRKALERNTKFMFYRKFKDNKMEVKEIPLSDKDTSVLLHSASTTGKAKTIMLSGRSFNFTASRVPEIMCMSETDLVNKTMVSLLPSFHGFGLCMTMHAPLVNGFSIALLPKFSSSNVVKVMNKTKNVISICGVPVVFKALANDPSFRNNRYLKVLQSCFSGGDSLPLIVKEVFDSAMIRAKSRCRLFEGYGLTEALSVSCVNTHYHHKSGSVGYPMAGVNFAILDENNNFLEPNEIGEIAIKSKNNMLGYYRDEGATKATYAGDYLKTGDVGYIDEDGFVYFTSRKKRVIKVSGVAVFPSEIESIISHIPGVKGVCAIQIPDENLAHAVKVLVVSNNKDPEIIKAEVKKHLISWAIPKEVEFVSSLPYTKYRKVDYRKLQKEEDKKRGIID